MDLVVRTSHGEAEISLELDGSSIGEVVAAVTGRPAPVTLFVDGRATPSSTPIDECALLTGSTISTDDSGDPESGPVSSTRSVMLEQVAGPGAGSTARLRPGRHVVGPGRRVSTAELGRAPVDEPMFEVDVGVDGTVGVIARHGDARLDGVPLGGDETPWGVGILDVAGRAFRLDRDGGGPMGRTLQGIGDRGTVPFNRPPRPAPTDMPAPPRPEDRSGSGRGSSRARARQAAEVAARRSAELEHRRSAQPDPVQAVRAACTTDPRLWERRPGDPDAFQIAIGLADLPGTTPLVPIAADGSDPGGVDDPPDPRPALAMVPVVIDLRAEHAVGVAGSDDFTAGVARSLLVLAATTHGPADLELVVIAGPDRAHTWEWVKWLPHNRRDGTPRLLVSRDHVVRWTAAVRHPGRFAPGRSERLTLVVVDEPTWWRERNSPLRPLLADRSLPLRHVALTHDVDDVPSWCTVVIAQRTDERVVVDRPASRQRIDDVRPFLLAPRPALDAARALAPLEDPDMAVDDETPLLPAQTLLDLLEMPEPTAENVGQRWEHSGGRLVATLGTGETGPATVDLLDDGPNVVVAGEAASELVAQIVVSLALATGPGDLDLVVVGAEGAMGSVAGLPHAVSRITDLDAHGVRRLLRCLQAELRSRQSGEGPPASQLLVAVGDLDALGGDPSDTLASLDDLARRGPDVGIHMVVGTTQHPGPAALLVDVPTDGLGALGSPDDGAASIAAQQPLHGATVVRIGERRARPFRPADSGGRGAGLRPFVVARDLVPMEQRLERTSRATDLSRLVDAVARAARRLDPASRRAPVPPPLPEHLPAREFLDRHPGDAIPFALADLPDEQEQVPVWWSPFGPAATAETDAPESDTMGPGLLVTGAAGAGTSSLLATLVLGAAARFSADDVHVYAIDADHGRLAALAMLPHVGAIVGPGDAEGAARLLHLLSAEVERRSAAPSVARAPAVVLIVDDVGALHRDLDGRHDLEAAWPSFERIVRDGRRLGIATLLTAKTDSDVPVPIVAGVEDRLVLDAMSAAALQLSPGDVPRFAPGRGLRTSDRVELQLAEPPADLDAACAAVGAEPATERPPDLAPPLPASITVSEIVGYAEADDARLAVPVGLDRSTGAPARLHLGPGESAFVTGPTGSGRSSVLVAVADAVARAAPDVTVFAAALHGGPLARVGGNVDVVLVPADVAAWVGRVLGTDGPRVVVVDDADRLSGPDIERLGSARHGDLRVVVAGDNDRLRAAGHWSRPLQRFRLGVLLEPTTADGDLVRVSLGSRLPRFSAHTGLLVDDGTIVPLLAAIATPAPTTGSDR